MHGASLLGPWDSVRLHPISALVPVILLVAAAFAFALLRAPTYTADTQLQVQLAAASPGQLPGAVNAATQFAASYARAVEATAVVRSTARSTGLSEEAVDSRLSATPVPGTSALTLTATGSDATGTIKLANAAAAAMGTYTSQTKTPARSSAELLDRYRTAARVYERRSLAAQEAGRSYDKDPSGTNRQALETTRTRAETAQLQRDSLRESYQQSQQLFTAPLRQIAPAASAASDRSQTLQLLGFLGLVAGVALGFAVAMVRANGLRFR